MQPLSRSYRGVTPSERVEQRRAQLIDAGVEVFGTVGYRAATIDQICAAAGLSKRYFYESFADGEALLLASYQRCADDIHQAMISAVVESGAPDLDTQLRAALTGYFAAIDDDQRRARITLLEILGVSPAVDAAYSAQTARFASSIQALAGSAFEASSRPEEQLHVLAEGLLGAITTIAMQWLLEGRRRPQTLVVDATHLLVSSVLDGLPGT